MKRTATSASRAVRPGFAGSLEPRPSALGESVRPPEQPPAVAEAAVLGGPHQQAPSRPAGARRPRRCRSRGRRSTVTRAAFGPDLRRPSGAVEPAPALLARPAAESRRPTGAQRRAPGSGVHQSEDRASSSSHRRNRVQIKAAAALRGHDRRVLDRQDRPAGAAPRRPRRRLGRHLLDRHRRVAQEAGQTDLPGPARPEPPELGRRARPSRPDERAGTPPFFQAAVAKPPQRSSIARSSVKPRQRIRHRQPARTEMCESSAIVAAVRRRPPTP